MTVRRRLAITLAFMAVGALGGAATAVSSLLPVRPRLDAAPS